MDRRIEFLVFFRLITSNLSIKCKGLVKKMFVRILILCITLNRFLVLSSRDIQTRETLVRFSLKKRFANSNSSSLTALIDDKKDGKIMNNENHLLQLLNNQTSVIESTINIIQGQEKEIEHEHLQSIN